MKNAKMIMISEEVHHKLKLFRDQHRCTGFDEAIKELLIFWDRMSL